ncbi:MAG TPA: tRNA uracil 4-sulfurtransferase ThiI [Actinomycetota bacterium]|nr:tRNA uracil 4-sulfurtransferase ThiI [Actinomycetota bacterium]
MTTPAETPAETPAGETEPAAEQRKPPAHKHHVVVAHYHEVGLKGHNRSYFERVLAANIRASLSGTGYKTVRVIPGRLLIELGPGTDTAAVLDRLTRVFGLASFSRALTTAGDMDAVIAAALALAAEQPFASFRVRARRGNSSFPASSQTVNEVVGQAIKDLTGARVDLSHAEWTCYIELVQNRAYLYAERIPGPGGLPAGSAGKIVALLSGGIDSPVAAWELAKRGASITAVHFHGQPYSDPSSARQAARLAQTLARWLGQIELWLVPFGDLQAEIVTTARAELRTVLYRRYMMRIAEALAHQIGAEALVTGESLGQVASQTLPNLRAIDAAVSEVPVLRPLIGRDKIEIEALARRIGTYDISIDPHQDCCVLFAPRQAATRARIPDLEAAEEALDTPALVAKALANAEPRHFPEATGNNDRKQRPVTAT